MRTFIITLVKKKGGAINSAGVTLIHGNAQILDNYVVENPEPYNGYGGGIYHTGAKLTISGHPKIFNNSALKGGGIYTGTYRSIDFAEDATLTMYGNQAFAIIPSKVIPSEYTLWEGTIPTTSVDDISFSGAIQTAYDAFEQSHPGKLNLLKVFNNHDIYYTDIPAINTFKIEFLVNEEVYQTQVVEEGELATKPDDPHVYGTDFVQWLDENDSPYDFGIPVEGDRTLTAELTPMHVENVHVHYVDEEANEVHPDEILSGVVGEGYEAERKEKDGYTLVQLPDNETGEFLEEEQNVTYVYHKHVATTEDVHLHIDENEVSLTDGFNDNNGYKEMSESLTDTTTTTNEVGDKHTVNTYTHIWHKKVHQETTVEKHVDEDGNELTDLSGYKLLSTSEPKIVDFEEFSNGDTFTMYEVTNIYGLVIGPTPDPEPKPEPVITSQPVFIQYEDEAGITLAPTMIVEGKIGDEKKVQAKAIDGYQLALGRPSSYSFTISDKEQVFTFVYVKTDTPPIPEPEAPVPTLTPQPITIHYVDDKGNTIHSSLVIHGEIGDVKKVTAPTIDWYTLVTKSATQSFTVSDKKQSFSFVYKREQLQDTMGEEDTEEEETLKVSTQTSGGTSRNTLPSTVESSSVTNAKNDLPVAGETSSSIWLMIGFVLCGSSATFLYKKQVA